MSNEASVRLIAFLGIFAVVAIWETLAPRRQLVTSKASRWFSNISITVLGTAIVRGFFPVLAATFAANETSAGILNQISLPSIEVMQSMGIKIAAVVIIGPPVPAVILFEILLNGTSMFNHGNIRMNPHVDGWLRLLVVTPDMHRVHHSVIIKETNSNFGFNFPWWDRLFGTYRPQPAAGHEAMNFGLSRFRDQKRLTLLWLLALPFIGKPGAYPILRKKP